MEWFGLAVCVIGAGTVAGWVFDIVDIIERRPRA